MRISDWSSDVCSSDLVIEYDDAHFWNFEEANVVFASPEAVNPAELVDLLDNACFSSSDDREADSWDTQHDRFLLDAQEMATRLLLGDEAALLERLRAILAYRTQWFVHEGAQFVAVIRSEEHTSELQSLMRNTYAVFCLNKNNIKKTTI